MGKYYKFIEKPQNVPYVKTRYRTIKTKIPVPDSIEIFKQLEKYESRSMHGQLPVLWDKAEDFLVFDKYGNSWIDFTSTIFVTNVGHSNPAIISAVEKQLQKKLIHTYTFASEIRAEFLKQLINKTPDFCEKAFLLSAGTEATECAVKLMRMYGQGKHDSKNIIIAFKGNMHGRTMAAEMLKGDEKSSKWIGYKDPNIYHLPFPYPWIKNNNQKEHDWRLRFQNDIDALEKKGLVSNDICGFILESYQGWGAIFYPKSYIQALDSFAKNHDILITFDEIQGGFGRSGKMFVFQHYDIEPDLICIGKGIGGGLSLSAVVGRKELMDLPEFGSMSSTHSANPVCCAAGLANLNSLFDNNLIEESKRKGKILHDSLNRIKEKYNDRIPYVFGKGLLAGVIFKNPATSEGDNIFASKLCEKCMQKGLLVVHTGREAIKFGPPLNITDEALIEGIEVFEESLRELINQEVMAVENQ